MYRGYSRYFGRMIWFKDAEDLNRPLQVGDTIKCNGAEDLVDTYNNLAKCGIITTCDYTEYRLTVVRIEE